MDSWNTVTEDATVKVVKTKRVAGLRQLDAASPMSFTALKSTCASILSGSVTGWWTARTSVMNMRGVQYCLNLNAVCNGTSECPEGDDEGYRCDDDDCQYANGGCSHNCTQTSHGAWCSCPAGLQIFPDNPKLCNDINECEEDLVCSQSCLNTQGSYYCGCAENYFFSESAGTCKVNRGINSVVYVAAGNSITYFNMSDSSKKTLDWGNEAHINALDGNSRAEKLYFTDLKYKRIMTSDLDGTNEKVLFSGGLGVMEDLAVDWVADLLYWTDSGFDTITVGTTDGLHRSVLFSANVTKPRSIAIDNSPTVRTMWWSDWGKNPRIERANMDGTNRTAIVSDDLYWPNAVAVDVYKQKIYFMDAKLDFIDLCNYDGSARRRLVINHDSVDHPWHMDIFEGNLWWVDSRRAIIEVCDKLTCHYVTHIAAIRSGPLSNIAIVSQAKQPLYDNPCKYSPCDHICIPNTRSHTCRCSTGYSLRGTRCVRDAEDFLMVSTGSMIVGQPLETNDQHFDSMVPFKINRTLYTMFDYDSRDSYVYWISEHYTRRAHVDGTGAEDFLPHLTFGPEAFAIDWLARNIYMADWSVRDCCLL
ncbi:hypothetical protein EB796_008358 [Bugula neritina]|uniref:EGF-like domain-containing protein n=1 Tax=Bugula neritina TaxID=10212 RepID=A0A7J7K3Z1_BUGNE|nr:hypothetical protein EB796_008358 [Bugula neritina]